MLTERRLGTRRPVRVRGVPWNHREELAAEPQSATSLPRAPQDEAGARSRRYLITMGIRIACFILMVVDQPYGWYTWVFASAPSSFRTSRW